MTKETLTKKGMCETLSNKLHMENLTEKQVYDVLITLWTTAFNEGYFKRLNEQKKFNNLRQQSIKRDFDTYRDQMDDTTSHYVPNQKK